MGCNCKASSDVNYLVRRFGQNAPANKKTHIISKINGIFKDILVWICTILLLPFILIKMLFVRFFKKNKEFKISKYFKIRF